jgi:hypothetical protein
LSAGPVISTGAARPAHRIVRRPPRASTSTLVEQAEADAGHDGGAGAGAAGQRLAGAALEHTQADAVARDDFHEAGVDAARESAAWRSIAGRVVATGADGRRRRRAHRVRVAHRHAPRPRRCGSPSLERPQRAAVDRRGARPAGVERARAAAGEGGAPMSTVTRPSSCRRSSITAVHGLDTIVSLVGQAARAHEAGEAARAVAALLDLAAVGVEDAVAEVDAGRVGRLDDEDLVGADAEAAVAEAAHLRARRARAARRARSCRVEHDEIVARAACIFVKRSFIRSICRSAP